MKKCIGAILISLMLCSSCGYQFTGGREMPAGVKRVFIKIFINNTSEIGIENHVTNDLINEFTQHHKESLANDMRDADAILTGEILSARFKTISLRGTNAARERRVTLSTRVRLVDRDGMVLWRSNRIFASGEYDVTADKMLTEQNRRNALADASARLAEEVYRRMTEDF